MKKLIFAMVLSLGFTQVASACGDGPLTGDFTTGDIRVRISAIDRCGSTFRYEAWNAPKRLGQGKADWTMRGEDVFQNNVYRIDFKKGNTLFRVVPVGDCDNLDCDANLDVFINGKKKQHYYLRRIIY